MDSLKDRLNAFAAYAAKYALGTPLVENLAVSVGLDDGYVVFFLESGNLATDAHTLRKQLDKLVVHLVNLTAKSLQALCRIGCTSDDEVLENDAQHLGRSKPRQDGCDSQS